MVEYKHFSFINFTFSGYMKPFGDVKGPKRSRQVMEPTVVTKEKARNRRMPP